MAQYAFNSLTPRALLRLETVYCEKEFTNNIVRSYVNFADFTLTATQLDTGNATPVTVLAAPGSGLATIVVGIVTYVVPGVTPFELGSGTLGYLYTDGSGASVATAVPNATVESATTTQYYSVPAAVVPVSNAVIVAKPSADVTAGDGTIYGRIFYRVVNLSELSSTISSPFI